MINEKELLALSDNEKLAIINFLQSNLFGASYQIPEDQQNIVAERIERIEKGDGKFYTLQQFEEQLIKRRS
jgi:hypothetical protein